MKTSADVGGELRGAGGEFVSLIDFWRAAEYLGAAARVFEIKRKAGTGSSAAGEALKHGW